ncbi:MAG: hypothetical protein H6647_14415 [Anaerolineales bacterium]|nr:hypothetical protein [Anaerolineales bacterium]
MVYKVCNQVWRWNLDRVEDANGNVVVYTYAQETNWYSSVYVPTYVHPTSWCSTWRRLSARIEYTSGRATGRVAPTAKVEFSVVAALHRPNTPGQCDWPEDYYTPGDLVQRQRAVRQQEPTFWITQKLSQVTTHV